MVDNHNTRKPNDQVTIAFKTKAYHVRDWTIIRLPDKASAKLPSRGQNMVRGSMNGLDFMTPLEPDGNWSHWFRLTPEIQKAYNLDLTKPIEFQLTTVKQWPDPAVPKDLIQAIKSSKPAFALWQVITPMARWEWVRWCRSTANPETRNKRLQVTVSKLNSGHKRPCCWNRNLCTEPYISKNGVLLLS